MKILKTISIIYNFKSFFYTGDEQFPLYCMQLKSVTEILEFLLIRKQRVLTNNEPEIPCTACLSVTSVNLLVQLYTCGMGYQKRMKGMTRVDLSRKDLFMRGTFNLS